MKTVYNAFTVDFEDWYQGIELPVDTWHQYEERIEHSANILLKLLREHDVKATFFVLGHNARRYPELIQRICAEGHQVGSHGERHEYIYKMTPSEFREDLERSIKAITDACGRRPESYRAPYFSITRDSLWALEHLVDCGIKYDSSIVPVSYYRYGIPDSPTDIHAPLTGPKSDGLLEFPISTVKVLGRRLPLSGGTYFRVLPYKIIRDGIRKLNSEGKPVIFYLHPWEIDPKQPRISLPLRVGLTHYANLSGTLTKLKKVLRDFKFAPMEEVIRNASN